MDLAAARFLISDEGRRAASELAGADLAERRLIESLRRRFDVARAAGLLDQELGRRSLEGRHPRAREVFTDRAAAEQASSWPAACWHARRFRDAARVTDLGCGIGIDSEALAGFGVEIDAIEADPARACLAGANLAAVGARHRVRAGTYPDVAADADLVFADPDRRPRGRRIAAAEEAEPPLSVLLELSRRVRGIGIKLSPMIDPFALLSEGEVELIELGGELKEIVLWTGSLARPGLSLAHPGSGVSLHASELESVAVEEGAGFGAYLLDPGPALRRAHLLGELATSIGGRLPWSDAEYATTDLPGGHPLLAAHAIEAVLPLQERALREHLLERGVGRIDVTVRRAEEDAERWRKRLMRATRSSPRVHRRVFVARSPSGLVAVVTRSD